MKIIATHYINSVWNSWIIVTKSIKVVRFLNCSNVQILRSPYSLSTDCFGYLNSCSVSPTYCSGHVSVNRNDLDLCVNSNSIGGSGLVSLFKETNALCGGKKVNSHKRIKTTECQAIQTIVGLNCQQCCEIPSYLEPDFHHHSDIKGNSCYSKHKNHTPDRFYSRTKSIFGLRTSLLPSHFVPEGRNGTRIDFSSWRSWKTRDIPNLYRLCQRRFYRGRMRKQSSEPLTVDDDAKDETDYERDLVTFHSELQNPGPGFGQDLLPASVEDMTIPELSRHACNIVPYVSRSETLQNLVKLGVNLDVVQRVEGVAELLLKSQFKRDIAPLIYLLSMAGVPADEMGQMLTRNPLLFMQSIEDLSARIGYLLHKRFSQEEVASIMVRAPVALLMDPVKLDSKLAFLQSTFSLTGQEVRDVVLKYPKLLPWRREMIANVRFHIKEFLMFSDSQLKEMLLKEPKIFLTSTNRLTELFDYLQTNMGITRQQILVWPSVLRSRPHIIRDRHLFLLARGRAQYDPHLENFVSMRVLAATRDDEFCRTVAKCEEAEYHAFLKTL